MDNNFNKIDKPNSNSFINKLMEKYKMPYIIMKVNYPGVNKSNEITNSIIENLDEIISDIFSSFIYFKALRITDDGPVVTYIINKEIGEIKNTMIEIEDKHTLGDCVNIDVYDSIMKKISRKDLGHPLRKCYLCNEPAKKCIKEKAHNQDQVIQYIVGKYRDYMENFYGKKV